MKKPQWMALYLCLPLALSGCGDGGSKQQAEPLVGTLQAGRPQGVQFQTPSQSGSTDAEGRFTYLPGETVTFSVAGVELGSVPGAAGVSLFTLAGLSPPTTERALRRELDRAQRISTPFTRAINMARLLMMLDADGNPDNGLDARGRESLVTAGSADLDLRVVDFADRIQQRSPLLTRNIPVWLPVAQLYQAVNVRVPAHGVTRMDVPGALGLPPRGFLNSYDSNGALVGEGTDYDGNGLPESGYRYGYDAMYRQIAYDGEGDADLDGVVDNTRSVRYAFDARGNLVQGSEEYDADGDGANVARWEHELHFDAAGDQTAAEVRLDWNGDGVFNSRESYVATFDARHNVLIGTWSGDPDNDGTVDLISTTRFTYDAQDRLLTRTYERDAGADGSVDGRDVEEFWYSPTGRVSRSVYTANYDLADGPEYISTFEATYDANGRALTNIATDDSDADGIADSRVSYTSTYDRDGRLLSQVRDEDWNADGVIESRDTLRVTFDEIGNPLEEVSELDDPVDSQVDWRFVTVYEYGADGQRLAYGSHYGPGDGAATTFVPSTLYTHQRFDDGVLLLAQYYFTHSGP